MRPPEGDFWCAAKEASCASLHVGSAGEAYPARDNGEGSGSTYESVASVAVAWHCVAVDAAGGRAGAG